MKKSALSLFLSILILLSFSAGYTPAVMAADNTYDIIGDYTGKTYNGSYSCTSNDGIVDRLSVATLDIGTYFDKSAVRITPRPFEESEKPIMLDHYSVSSLHLSIVNLKYISFYCFYDGESEPSEMLLKLMPQERVSLRNVVSVYSTQKPKKGEWQWITFDVGLSLYGMAASDGELAQFHLLPYGSVPSSEVSEKDVFYISEIRYVSADSASVHPVMFSGARPDVYGTDPETVYAEVGSSVVLPQNPYTRENYTFTGWICSADGQKYQPGDSYTVTTRSRKTGYFMPSYTGEALFLPDWEYSGEQKNVLPEILSASYGQYYGNLLGNKNCATVTKNYEFLGRNVLKAEINTASSEYVNLDGWEWNSLPLDVGAYSYMTITYYLDSPNSYKFIPVLRFLQTEDGMFNPGVFINSENPVESGKWAVMCFDLSTLRSAAENYGLSDVIKQFHLRFSGQDVTGSMKASDFADGDCLYIDAVTLYREKPQSTPTVKRGVFNGYTDGMFKAGAPMTRAEGAQLIYNILVSQGRTEMPKNPVTDYADAEKGAWYYEAVANLDTLGIVPSEENFRPFDNLTVGEYLLFMTNIGLGGNYDAPMYLGSTDIITRGEAAEIASDFLTDGIPQKLLESNVKMFSDLDITVPEYLPVMNLAATRLVGKSSDGSEEIYQLLCPGSNVHSVFYDTTAASRYIKQTDILEAQRISEIRNAVSEYSPRSGRYVYYVSSSEGTASGGASADNPRLVGSLSEVTKLGAQNGDVVLFRRGDVFRGQLTASAGVTYGAYDSTDDGVVDPKPEFRRSEKNHTGAENWTEYYSDGSGKTIWKTAYTVSNDVGAVILNEGSIVGVKEIPDYRNGAYYIRDGSELFDVVAELDNNYEFFHDIGSTSVSGSGYLYMRCDDGNPGGIFDSIEFNQYGNCITIRNNSNVTIDNLCIKYFGSHGIGASTVANLTVQNCEIGFGGGSIQYYSNGRVVRYGNGVEIYGGLVNFTIDNCYVYEIYDAGITHQISSSSPGNYYMQGVSYTNNVLVDSTYNIEYFMSSDAANAKSERFMKDVYFGNNIIRRAGYGWGAQRPDSAPAGIKGWTHYNSAVNFVVSGNIIDRCYNKVSENYNNLLMQFGAAYNGSAPYLEDNVFVQVIGRRFIRNAATETDYICDYTVENTLEMLGAKGNRVYFAAQDGGK